MPAPVSMFLRGSSVSLPSASRLRLHEDQVPDLDEALGRRRAWGRRRAPYAGPLSMKISESGPQGPVSPMAQKLSSSPMRWIRSGRTPTVSIQICSASSSLSCTVTQRRSPSRPKTSVRSSQAIGMASALK